ncbi:MAG: zinc ribbon domain-containing protein [Methanoregula sp.]|nr:zinc ribbon domain-containing protein [Methanoregula sp.]
MGIPELYHDETIIHQAHNIKVKSVVFDAVLTSNRLILIDSKKGLIPPQEILLRTISSVDGGENAIRDPILTFTIMAKGSTARQMILTFPREASGERRRERDDWLKDLKEQIASLDPAEIYSPAAEPEPEPVHYPEITPPSVPEVSGSSTQKKKIDSIRPRRTIIDSVPSMPRPVETSSLPIGSFCSRCGNRVPPESAFCNRCGTPVAGPAEQTVTTPPATISSPPVAMPTIVPQVQVPLPPIFGLGTERKERTLEEVIHSIEPLIEDSVPRRSEPAPLVPRQYPAPPPFVDTTVIETPAEVPPVVPVPVQVPAAEPPVLPVAGEPALPEGSASAIPVPAAPPVAAPPVKPPRKSKTVAIAIVAIVLLAAIVGIVLFSNSLGTTPQAPVITPTITPVPTVVTTAPTPVPTPVAVVTIPEEILTPTPQPQVAIPPNGVWIRVTYENKYSGTYGTPANQMSVGEKNTGDQFFMISTVNGPVVASIQKLDGSSGLLAIEVYKNGISMDRKTTTAPKGIIDFQVDLKPAATPTPVVTRTVTPAETIVVNSTGTA